MRWAVHVARVEGMRNTYRVLVGKYEAKVPLGKIIILLFGEHYKL
jgi:hypothetical protein